MNAPYAGEISIDEHTSVPCIVCEGAGGSAVIVLLDADAVPETFLVTMRQPVAGRVYQVDRRTDETITVRLRPESA